MIQQTAITTLCKSVNFSHPLTTVAAVWWFEVTTSENG